MKYLNRREEFLNGYKNIVTEREKFVSEKEEMITEDSGPFANDIGWGDSLLGRLINSTIRKAKIGANLVRIGGVGNRLKEAMDDLLLQSATAELDEKDKAEYAKAIISTYLITLEEATKTAENIDVLKNLTDEAIGAAERTENLEGKNELIRQLNEFKKYLEKFEDEGEEGQEESQDAKSGNVESNPSASIYLKNFAHLYDMLLIYRGIESEMGEIYRMKAAEKSGLPTQSNKPAKPTQRVSAGGATASVNAGHISNFQQFMMIAESGAAAGTTASAGTSASSASLSNTVGQVVGKIYKFITGQKDERKLDEETKLLWTKLKELYRLFSAQKGALQKGSDMHRFLQDIDGAPKNTFSKYRSVIEKIYTRVRLASGLNENAKINESETQALTLLAQDEKIGKAIFEIYSVTKKHQDGKFMQYPGSKGVVWEEFMKEIAGFNSTMKEALSVSSKWNAGDLVKWKSESTGKEIRKEIVRVEGKKLVFKDAKGEEFTKFSSEVEKAEEVAQESRLMRYEDFQLFEGKYREMRNSGKIPPTKGITTQTQNPVETTQPEPKPEPKPEPQPEPQSQGQGQGQGQGQSQGQGQGQGQGQSQGQEEKEADGEVSGWKNPSSLGKIRDWFEKNMDLQNYVLKKTEVEKVRINLEKKLAEKKDSIVIQGMDPVLEIVKVFNRAYKLHTTQVIPTGRSGGKVSNKTFMEYHCFGSGTPANAGEQGGPYRNIAIFNKWEDYVNDVMKDKRYQKIFNVGTTMKVGEEYIEKAGMNLRKFMSDMLDGEELYKGGTGKEQGAQAKFLDKYFGYKADPEGKDTFFTTNDRDDVTNLSGQIKDVDLELKPFNASVKYEKVEDLKGTFFMMQMKKGDESSAKTYYFYIQDMRGGELYLMFAHTAYYMREYLKKAKGNVTIKLPDGIKTREKKDGSEPFRIYATKIKPEILYKRDGSFQLSSEGIEMGIVLKKSSEDESESSRGWSLSGRDVDNSFGNRKYETIGKEQFKVVGAQHIVEKGTDTRAKATGKNVRLAMIEVGGFDDIAQIEALRQIPGIKKI